MSERYALLPETLSALGLDIEDSRFTLERIGGACRVVYVLQPWDLRLLRRLVELLTGEPLSDEAQVHAAVRRLPSPARGAYSADVHGLWAWFWMDPGGVESGDLFGQGAASWLHAVCLAAVSVANERGSGAHCLYVDRGEGWEVCDD